VIRRFALLAIPATALVGCGGAAPVVEAPRRTPVELDVAQVRAIAQILRYEDRREFDAAAFDRLADGDVEVRRRVAVAAGRIGDPQAATLLVRLLDDDASTAVRADAAFALGELGDTSRLVMESLRGAVPSGWVPVRDRETDVVVEVIHALGRLGTFDARAQVVDALRAAHPGAGENARRVAAEALLSVWRFDSGPGRVSAAVRYVDVPDPELRWRAAYALIRLGDAPDVPGVRPVRAPTEAARQLLTLLDDDDHRARAAAARGLTPPMVDSAGVRDTAVAALTAALGDQYSHVRVNAVRALADYDRDAPVAAMAARLDDPDPAVAIAAAGALREMAGQAASELAAVAGSTDRPMAVRAEAARALSGTDPDTVQALVAAWADGEFDARYAAARTFSALGWSRAEPVLRRLAGDEDVRVAVAALSAAGEMAADSAAPQRRTDALRSLLEAAARGADHRVAIVAIRALEPLLDPDVLGALRDETGAVEDATPPGGTERSIDFYEDVVRTYVAPSLAGRDLPRAVIRTEAGDIEVELLADEAPLTVQNFVHLARAGFWNDGVWHRVIPNFVLQDGAPAGDPGGGPGWSIRDEINRVRYVRGIMGMALAGPDTGGSQWFITHSPQHHLDGGYTVFGRVIGGMDAADAVLQGDPIEFIRIP
jgi:cyclophilin family peptidyl-prolyl cis-trans isomerase